MVHSQDNVSQNQFRRIEIRGLFIDFTLILTHVLKNAINDGFALMILWPSVGKEQICLQLGLDVHSPQASSQCIAQPAAKTVPNVKKPHLHLTTILSHGSLHSTSLISILLVPVQKILLTLKLKQKPGSSLIRVQTASWSAAPFSSL